MRCICTVWLLLAAVFAFGQGKYDANWVFGVKAGISFVDTANPTNFNTLCNNYNAAASISDSLGNLLFYVAPDTPFVMNAALVASYSIFNGRNEPMADGSNLYVGARMHNSVFLPVPDSENDFYFLYLQQLDSFVYDSGGFVIAAYVFDRLCYTHVKDGNVDSVINKNIIISDIAVEWKMSAVKHSNGKDWWLILHSYNKGVTSVPDNTYLRFLVTSDTILGPFTQNIGFGHRYSLNGQSAFNSSGTRFISALNGDLHAEVFDFDRCTGLLSNFIDLGVSTAGSVLGAEFSSDGRKIYFSETLTGPSSKNRIYQYSLDAPNVSQSKQVIWEDSISNNPLFNFGRLARAPNNKIYLTVASGPSAPYPYNYYNAYNQNLWVINTPDSLGTACNFQPLGYYLGDSARSYYSLPNMPNYNLGPLTIYQADAGIDKSICISDTAGLTIGGPAITEVTYSWQGSNISDTAIAQPTVRPTQSGWYYVTVTDTSIRYSCQSRTDSVYVEVRQCCNSVSLALATAGRDTSFCREDTTVTTITIGEPIVAGITYTWQQTNGITDIHNPTQQVRPDGSRWYYVTLGDSSAGCPTRMDSVYVEVQTCCDASILSLVSVGNDTSICKDSMQSVALGSTAVAGVAYVWRPSIGLNNSHSAQPMASSDTTTAYVLSATDTSQRNLMCASKTDTVLVRVIDCDTTGIEQLAVQQINVYPNPASNELVIETQAVGKTVFRLCDIVGHPLLHINLNEPKTVLDISSLPQGLYFYRVNSQSGKVQVVR